MAKKADKQSLSDIIRGALGAMKFPHEEVKGPAVKEWVKANHPNLEINDQTFNSTLSVVKKKMAGGTGVGNGKAAAKPRKAGKAKDGGNGSPMEGLRRIVDVLGKDETKALIDRL